MRLILMSVLALGFLFATACTSTTPQNPGGPVKDVACSLETSVAGGMAGAVAGALSCSNVGQIQADILAKLDFAKFCPVQTANAVKAQSIVGSIVCPVAVQSALGLVAQKIPSSWGCAPGASTSTLSDALTKTCMNLVGGP